MNIAKGDRVYDDGIGVTCQVLEVDPNHIPPQWARLRDIDNGDVFMEHDLEMSNWRILE